MREQEEKVRGMQYTRKESLSELHGKQNDPA